MAQEKGTPQECIRQCQDAMAYLKAEIAKGPDAEKAALAYMNQKEGNRFVWKDTYVWVLCCQCDVMTNIAHPINQKIVGPDLSGLKDKKGNLFFIQFCDVAKQPQGGWVQYWWPKVGETKSSRKVTYVLPVPGTKYQVAAGVYDEVITADELNKLIR
jgi:signal transduction histidine kinase